MITDFIHKKSKKVFAVTRMQKTEMFRNLKTIVVFCVFPVSLIIISFVEKSESLGFIMMMGCILPPMLTVASKIGEDRERGVLRGLLYSGLKWNEYLMGIMIFVGLISFLFVCVMGMILDSVQSSDTPVAIIITSMLSIICSMTLGGVIGITSKNQNSIPAIQVPVSLFLVFSAVLGMTDEKIHKITKYLYTQAFMDMYLTKNVYWDAVLTMVINCILFIVLFGIVYVKRKKED